jgi:hypothetical protein
MRILKLLARSQLNTKQQKKRQISRTATYQKGATRTLLLLQQHQSKPALAGLSSAHVCTLLQTRIHGASPPVPALITRIHY